MLNRKRVPPPGRNKQKVWRWVDSEAGPSQPCWWFWDSPPLADWEVRTATARLSCLCFHVTLLLEQQFSVTYLVLSTLRPNCFFDCMHCSGPSLRHCRLYWFIFQLKAFLKRRVPCPFVVTIPMLTPPPPWVGRVSPRQTDAPLSEFSVARLHSVGCCFGI